MDPSKCQLVPLSFVGCLRRHPKAVTSSRVLAQLISLTRVGPGPELGRQNPGKFWRWRWGGQQ